MAGAPLDEVWAEPPGPEVASEAWWSDFHVQVLGLFFSLFILLILIILNAFLLLVRWLPLYQ